MSISEWDEFTTVSFRREQVKDEQKGQQVEQDHKQGKISKTARIWFELSSWAIP